MADFIVKKNQEIVVSEIDGNLILEEGATVIGESGIINVNGKIICYGNNTLKGDVNAVALECLPCSSDKIIVDGSLTIAEHIKIEEGSLFVKGDLTAKSTYIDKKLQVAGNLSSNNVDVGGSIEVGGNVKSAHISIGGILRVEGNVDAESVSAGGLVKIKGSRNTIQKLDVGGTAEVGGGTIDNIKIGGIFRSFGKLEFKKISVGGIINLMNDGKGEKIHVGGKLSLRGSLDVESLSVGGMANVKGTISANSISISGKMNVDGSLKNVSLINIGGILSVTREINASHIKVGGKIIADYIESDEVYVGGKIKTKRGVKAKIIELGKHGVIKGPVIGVKVKIGFRSKAETIYSEDEIIIDEECIVKRLFGKRIIIGSKSKIKGPVVYVESLDVGQDVKFKVEPQKVDSLPPPESVISGE
ncbi:MAG: hypothetical protein ACP6IS_09890 [Candidatus Asgardarchaeia archaeon]